MRGKWPGRGTMMAIRQADLDILVQQGEGTVPVTPQVTPQVMLDLRLLASDGSTNKLVYRLKVPG